MKFVTVLKKLLTYLQKVLHLLSISELEYIINK